MNFSTLLFTAMFVLLFVILFAWGMVPHSNKSDRIMVTVIEKDALR